MSQSIRQEINIICGLVTGTGTVTSSAIVQLDTTKYDGTVTYYFEAVYNGAASNTGTVKLRDIAAASNVASLAGATSATYTINRVAFTPTAGAREYTLQIVGDATRTQNVHCARIIILQTDPTKITKTEAQIEIGNQETAKTNSTAAALTTPKYWKYTTANWLGALDFFVEVVWSTSAKNTLIVTLQEDDGALGTWSNASSALNNIVNSGTNSTGSTRTRIRFSPRDGRSYRIVASSSTSKSSYSIYCAKIIITHLAGGITVDLLDPANAFTGSIQGGTAASGQSNQAHGQSFTPTWSSALTRIDWGLTKTGSPTDNLFCEILTGSISSGSVIATSANVAGTSVTISNSWITFTFSTVNLTANTTYYLRLRRDGANDTTNYYIILTSSYNALVNGTDQSYHEGNLSWTPSASVDAGVRIFLDDAPVQKLEPQFLLLNTADSNATGVQNYLTTWTSSEWGAGGGTITYNHVMDSDNASNSIKLRNVTDSDDVTSTVTGSGQQVSSALTVGAGELVTAKNYDTWVLNTTGVVAAGRIQVLYVYAALATRRIFITGG